MTATTESRWHVGEITITRVDEIELPEQTGPWLLPNATKELVGDLDWLHPDFADGEHTLRLASHSFAVRAGGQRILVDTAIGNSKQRANPAWHNLNTDYLDRLIAAGFPPEDIDLVIITHLHTDHVGWNTRLHNGQWVPTFPNARHLTSRTEWDYWSKVDKDAAREQMFRDSVYPIHDSRQLELVDVPTGGLEVAPGIRLRPVPGHTPGQVAVWIENSGQRAVITGDSVHHPVQLAHPHVTSCVDIDPAQAQRTRRELLESIADTDTLLLGTHFPTPTGGVVRRQGKGYRLVPAPTSARP